MSITHPTAKVKLIVVIVPYELSEQFALGLEAIGIHAYTTMKVDGRGDHGARKAGLLDSANIRYEVLATPALANTLLEFVEKNYTGRAVIAYALDAEAVPHHTFK